jgi:small glutamine-rich tetratricopeptide repeat-containing protein alpha
LFTQVVDEDDKQKAEDLKVQGNRKMAEQNYPEAIRLYSEAISHNPNNAVFYGNRAAAYSQQGSHDQAVEDSKTAVELDPKYSKAYSRMGHAYFSLTKYQDAIDAYEKGLELDPSNATLKSSIEAARNKINSSGLERSTSPPSGGRGGGSPFPGGVGGMPDLGSLLNNPAMMNMAQQMMQSGAFNDLMQNPEMMANMAQQFMGGNGCGLADMMRDPETMNRARQFMNSMGGSGAGANDNNEQNNEQ